MDLRTLTKLFLKLMGLYWLTASLVAAISAVALAFDMTGTDVATYRLLNMVGHFVVGCLLLWYPGVIVNRVLRIEGAELEGAVTAERLLGVGISLLGLYFTIVAISALIYSIEAFADLGGDHVHEQISALVAWAVQLLIGLGLIFKRRRVMKIIADANR